MGTLITTSIMIKLLLTSALLALPAAAVAYAPVAAVAHAPVVKSDVIKPAEVSHEVAAAPVVTYAHPHFGYYGKRSADAEPEAEADAYYGYYGYARPYAYGYAYGYYDKRSADAEPAAEADADALYGYYGYPYRYRAYGKRSADAEPEAEAEADAAVLYGAFGYAGYPYGLTYGAGIAATNNVLGHAVAYTAGGVTHSSNVGVCTNYLGAQVPC